jgi:hypothetical protein
MNQALILGLMHQSILSPEDVPPQVVRDAFRPLGKGVGRE